MSLPKIGDKLYFVHIEPVSGEVSVDSQDIINVSENRVFKIACNKSCWGSTRCFFSLDDFGRVNYRGMMQEDIVDFDLKKLKAVANDILNVEIDKLDHYLERIGTSLEIIEDKISGRGYRYFDEGEFELALTIDPWDRRQTSLKFTKYSDLTEKERDNFLLQTKSELSARYRSFKLERSNIVDSFHQGIISNLV